MRLTHSQAGKPDKGDTLNVAFFTRGDLTRVDLKFPKEAGELSIVAAPGDMLFSVSQRSPGVGYKIDAYGARSEQALVPTRFLLLRYEDIVLKCPTHVGMFDVQELITDPLCQINELAPDDRQGEKLVRVGFSLRPSSETRGFQGSFSLSASRKMAVKSYEYAATDDHATVFKGKVEYPEEDATSAIPRSMEHHATAGRAPTTDILCQFSSFESATSPEAQFTLGAFGLGDFDPGKRSGRAIWFFIGSTVALLVGIGALLVLRRRKGPENSA